MVLQVRLIVMFIKRLIISNLDHYCCYVISFKKLDDIINLSNQKAQLEKAIYYNIKLKERLVWSFMYKENKFLLLFNWIWCEK